MKIVYLSTFYPLRGGIAHFNSLLAATLIGRGHHVLPMTFSRQYPTLLFPGKTQDEVGGGPPPEGHPPAEILLDSINPLSWIEVGLRIAREAPDMVLFKYWIPFFAPAYATISCIVKLACGAKIVYVLDNYIPHEARPGDTVLRRIAMWCCDGYIAMSDEVLKGLKQEQPNAVVNEAPHPTYTNFGDPIPKDAARKALGLNEDEPVLLFFGYIRKYKGLDILLQALKALGERIGNYTLVIAGEFYGNEEETHRLIDSLGIGSRIHLATDYIANDEVGAYFSAADVVVLPYRSATQSGIVQIAYHFGVPAVVTDVGGLAEVVKDGHTGVVVTPNSPEAVAEGIVRCIELSKHHDFAAAIAQERVKYSWTYFAERLEALYERLLTR